MQVTEQAAEGLKRGFSVVVPAADIAAARDKRLAAVAKEVRIPGFRPGKVPASVVKQRFDDQGLYGVGSTAQEFQKVIDDEFALNQKLTTVMGIVPQ